MTLDELTTVYGTSSYVEFSLNDMIEQLGEEKTKAQLSLFSCPLNHDVEVFLKEKSIEFSKRDFSKTFLVYWVSSDQSSKELVGYYTVAEKTINIDFDILSKNERRKLYGHGHYRADTNILSIPAPLIAQLGKNYNNGNDSLISGEDLLLLAMNKIEAVKNIIGGKIAYLECEDIDKLRSFYEGYGFRKFGQRNLDCDETDLKGTYLLQYFIFI